MEYEDRLERGVALACWAEIATDAVQHVEGFEFRTPTAIYFVMEDSEAQDYFEEEVEQGWLGYASRIPNPGIESEYDYKTQARIDGRGHAIACDGKEHEFNDWYIYKVANR